MGLMIFHKNDWMNNGENENDRYLTIHCEDRLTPAVQRAKIFMKEHCIHEAMFPAQKTVTLGDDQQIDLPPGRNPLCPISTTKGKVDECSDQVKIIQKMDAIS